MNEFVETLSSVPPALITASGVIVSSLVGLIMSFLSSKSINYRKVDKRLILSCFLFLLFLNIFAVIITFVLTIVIIIAVENFTMQILISLITGIFTIVFFWGVIVRLKILKYMMTKLKEVSKRAYLVINLISMSGVVLTFVFIPYSIIMLETGEQSLTFQILNYVSWASTAWWFILIISVIRRAANYVYSEMRITLLDGEVISYSCMPQMCRVHKHYIRLLKRDENGAIIYERHINEAAIQQIEYS